MANAQAVMVLAAAGDAIGYRNGRWEFRLSTQAIHDELDALTGGRGMRGLVVTRRGEWLVSDDTVLHLATAEGIVAAGPGASMDTMMRAVAERSKRATNDMTARAPGRTTQRSLRAIDVDGANWARTPFNRSGGGCGAAMRSACLGVRFANNEAELIAASIEVGRLTHHHPTGYLGGLFAAYGVALGLAGVAPVLWCERFLALLPRVRVYLESSGREARLNLEAFDEGDFAARVRTFMAARGLDDATATTVPTFPEPYGVPARDAFQRSLSFRGINPGGSGYDCVLIALDGLLAAIHSPPGVPADPWTALCHVAVLHGGDNDSTGTVAGAFYGALFGFAGVPAANYADVEYVGRARNAGKRLHRMSEAH